MVKVGEQFGDYLLEGELGTGGMATVYAARSVQTEERVAIKILHEHFAKDNSIKQRFQREGQITQQLRHSNIVTIHDAGEADGRPYLVMDFMSGGSLEKYFSSPRKIKWRSTLNVLMQLAKPLDFAHQQGVIHRDLKLQNILLDDKRTPYISDFGIARMTTSTRLTATGSALGTPSYMSPEQVSGSWGDVDYRSDLYAFAVMAYLMLTGYFPFTAPDPIRLLMKHINEEPALPTDVNPALPDAVNEILLKGLAKDPLDRYQTATEFVKALHQAIGTQQRQQTEVHTMIANPMDELSTRLFTQDERDEAETQATVAESSLRRYRVLAIVATLLAIFFAIGFFLTADNEGGTSEVVEESNPNGAMVALAAEETEAPNELIIETQTPTLTFTPLPTETPTATNTPVPTQTFTPLPTTQPTETSVTINAPPAINAIENQRDPAFTPILFRIEAADPEGSALRYIAEGLPDGLEIEPGSGVIFGEAWEAGSFNVTITVIDDERNADETTFWWIIDPDPEHNADTFDPIEPIEPVDEPIDTPPDEPEPDPDQEDTEPPDQTICYYNFIHRSENGGFYEDAFIELKTADDNYISVELDEEGNFIIAREGNWDILETRDRIHAKNWEDARIIVGFRNGNLVWLNSSAGAVLIDDFDYVDWEGNLWTAELDILIC